MGSQLLATAPSSPAIGFLDDLLGFNASLIEKPKQDKLFDPSLPSSLPSSSAIDSGDSDDGTSLFKSTAMSKSNNTYELRKTRSQSESLSKESAIAFKKGELVFAHKGKVVPCWFPGVVESRNKNGSFKVKFLADFGQKDCVTSSMMSFKDYAVSEVWGCLSKVVFCSKEALNQL